VAGRVRGKPRGLGTGGGRRAHRPIALGILLASRQIRLDAAHAADPGTLEFYGELGLSGELKSVPGMLLAAAHTARVGHEVVVPQTNAEAEALEVAAIAFGSGMDFKAGHFGRRPIRRSGHPITPHQRLHWSVADRGPGRVKC
jgi:hypothetical protein